MKKKKGLKYWFTNLLLLLLLLCGLALVFNNQIKNLLIKNKGKEYQIEQITPEDLDRNSKKEASFDFGAVKPASSEAVLRAQLENTDLPIIGWVSVPSVGIKLPIFKGLANEALLFGAGTLSPTQEMGKGNYSLASHRMDDSSLLFTPLDHVAEGADIYITDLKNVYHYKANLNRRVEPTEVALIDEVPGKELITLITCGEMAGETRRVVQGELVDTISYADATMDTLQHFK